MNRTQAGLGKFVRADPLPFGVVYCPLERLPPHVVGCVFLQRSSRGTVWLVSCLQERTTNAIAARLTALVVVHHQCPIVHPTLNPRLEIPGFLLIGENGFIGDRRGAFNKNMIAEIDRVAGELSSSYPDYVEAAAQAMAGNRPGLFESLPDGIGVEDPKNECSWAPLPPAIPVEIARLAPYDVEDVLFHLTQMDYRKERYLEHLTDEEVLQRAEDALINTHNFEAPRQVLLDFDDPRVVRATARLGEATEELRHRQPDKYQEIVNDMARRWMLPKESDRLISAVVNFIRSFDKTSVTDGLIRYDKKM